MVEVDCEKRLLAKRLTSMCSGAPRITATVSRWLLPALIAGLIGGYVPVVSLLLSERNRNYELQQENLSFQRELSKVEEKVEERCLGLETENEALRKALQQGQPAGLDKWQDGMGVYALYFYVRAEGGEGIAGAQVKVDGQVALTLPGGLSGSVLVKTGQRILITAKGYESQETVVDQEVIAKLVIPVLLRRETHVPS